MPRGGSRQGAGRRPIGGGSGDPDRLLAEAHRMLLGFDAWLEALMVSRDLDAARVEGAAIEAARTGMRASRRLKKAARLLGTPDGSHPLS